MSLDAAFSDAQKRTADKLVGGPMGRSMAMCRRPGAGPAPPDAAFGADLPLVLGRFALAWAPDRSPIQAGPVTAPGGRCASGR